MFYCCTAIKLELYNYSPAVVQYKEPKLYKYKVIVVQHQKYSWSIVTAKD